MFVLGLFLTLNHSIYLFSFISKLLQTLFRLSLVGMAVFLIWNMLSHVAPSLLKLAALTEQQVLVTLHSCLLVICCISFDSGLTRLLCDVVIPYLDQIFYGCANPLDSCSIVETLCTVFYVFFVLLFDAGDIKCTSDKSYIYFLIV